MPSSLNNYAYKNLTDKRQMLEIKVGWVLHGWDGSWSVSKNSSIQEVTDRDAKDGQKLTTKARLSKKYVSTLNNVCLNNGRRLLESHWTFIKVITRTGLY